MTLGSRLKDRPLPRNQSGYFSTPAKATDSPRFDLWVASRNRIQQRSDQRYRLWRTSWAVHELDDSSGLDRGLGGEVGHVLRVLAEEVGHEDLEVAGCVGGLAVAGCEDVGAFQGLDVEAKDVVN